MFEYVWCGSSVLPVDLSACMRLKHNLVWCCEDRPWIVQSIREIDGCSLSSCWELHCTCKDTRSCCVFACTQRLLGKTAEFVSDASPGAQRRLESATLVSLQYIQCRKYGYDDMTWCDCWPHCHIRLIWTLPWSAWWDVIIGVIDQTRDLSGSWASLFPASSRGLNDRNLMTEKEMCVFV